MIPRICGEGDEFARSELPVFHWLIQIGLSGVPPHLLLTASHFLAVREVLYRRMAAFRVSCRRSGSSPLPTRQIPRPQDFPIPCFFPSPRS
jgi:hypothetical protein